MESVLFFFGEEILIALLIATPNDDNANGRQKKGKKAKLQATIILMQKRKVSVSANYLDNVLVWNYNMSWFKRGMEMAGTGLFLPVFMS